MERTRIIDLNHWFSSKKRKPLVLRGARQVGKSTLVRIFAESKGLHLAEINLEVNQQLNSVFKTLDMKEIVRSLESHFEIRLHSKTLIFLDEIQACPYALPALRYFYEQYPEWPIVAAGSLLEFTLANHEFSMPVGRIKYLHIGPMTFKEYLKACSPFLKNELDNWTLEKPLALATHQKLEEHQREYLLLGGMPEVIDTFLQTKSMIEAQEIQRGICETYMDDFSKYAKSRDLAEMQVLFKTLPAQVGNKIKYVNLLPEAPSAHTKGLLLLLERAKIIHSITRSHGNGVPLGAEANPKFRKPLFLDVGLLSYILGLTWNDTHTAKGQRLVNEGALAEQYVGQHLVEVFQNFDGLHYWARESKKSNAEIDYLVSCGQHVIPIEVKAAKAGSLKSLHQFMHEKNRRLAVRFDQNPASLHKVQTSISDGKRDVEVDYNLLSLPFYAIEHANSILEQLRFELP
ncbi:MAG: ATP-binding protein [Planctomycetes bacterium]|nr:ATP-binding protein [Planctomycetota bacterium]